MTLTINYLVPIAYGSTKHLSKVWNYKILKIRLALELDVKKKELFVSLFHKSNLMNSTLPGNVKIDKEKQQLLRSN